MLDDYRLWLAASSFFLISSAFSFIFKHLLKRTNRSAVIYALASVLLFIGVGFNLRGSLQFSDILNPLMAAVFICGLLNALTPLFLPLIMAAPVLFSIMMHVPLRSFEPDAFSNLGTLKFFPSNEGTVTVDWIDQNEKEHFFSLEGDSAALIIRKRTVPDYLFFLKNEVTPLGILSKSVVMSELPEEETPWFKPFPQTAYTPSSLYTISYPALKYHSPGFFNAINIYTEKGQLFQERK